MDQVGAILEVRGSIPRRAVLLPDGRLADKTACPGCAELDILSRLCEVVRGARGAPCYPRLTSALLERALDGNEEGAWEAVRDDILTGDLDVEVCCALLSHGSNASTVVGCVVGARNAKHLLHVCCLMARALDDGRLRDETRADMGRALACQLRPLLDTLLAHGSCMPLDVRDAVFDGLARILAVAAVPDAHVADAALHALECHREDLLRIFLKVTPAFVDHRPQILPMLLDRLASGPRSSRYPVLELLARIVEHDPRALAGSERDTADLVAACLEGADRVDSRECMAFARIVAALGTHASLHERLCAVLANALLHTSAAVIQIAGAGAAV